MELLSALVFCAVLLCSNAESEPAVASANCSDTEKEAGVALDLINKHRSDGYIFSLLRVADAHVQHVGNASIYYFTLDVLETECPVISRKDWVSCGSGPLFGTSDFGRCNAVVQIDQSSQKWGLYGYNCTMSPVPPKLYECKECSVNITVLDNVQQYAAEAERLMERYNRDSDLTKGFKVEKVTKVLLAESNRTGYFIEFTIKETMCLKAKFLSQPSECKFLPDEYAHTGFCSGKILNDTTDTEVVEVKSCEIFDIQPGKESHPGRRGHPHDDSGEHSHRCSACSHRCHHRHHHFDPHCLRCNATRYGCRHHFPHYYDHPLTHRHRHTHCRSCGAASRAGQSNSTNDSEEKDNPDFPPPPGPNYPPPPPGGPHHLPPSRFPSPPAGPPPPPPERPGVRPSGCWSCRGHRHNHRWNKATHEREDGSSSPLQSPPPLPEAVVGSVHRIQLPSLLDVLQAPAAEFSFPLHDKHEKPAVQPFPLTPSDSESCPAPAIFELPFDLLSLYPPLKSA
ncbi:histidine-rich glycoprotein [Sphaerodactylus townsendi]|uniref:histidine-rich glycoprotein n=1 Tax=Sphaerodactylus townsendi TaxID=933632 RepID=UPI0020264D79|nr:histidine-rich glycoprotein [Sphaerodactylus townsendi]